MLNRDSGIKDESNGDINEVYNEHYSKINGNHIAKGGIKPKSRLSKLLYRVNRFLMPPMIVILFVSTVLTLIGAMQVGQVLGSILMLYVSSDAVRLYITNKNK